MAWRSVATLLVVISTAAADCIEDNVSLDGQVHSSTPASSAVVCQASCDSGRCSHWYYSNGDCTILRIASPGNKVGTLGSVAGVKNGTSCPTQTTGIQCYYTDTRDPVTCLFPFIGEVPGDRNSTTQHNSCLRTKRGRYWCATKLSLDNKLLAASDQTKDIECGLQTNTQGEFYCMSSTSCPSMVSVQQRIAELEKTNRELEAQISSGSCVLNRGFGSWSQWSQCSQTCDGQQTRTRECLAGKTCSGSTTDTQACGGSCSPAAAGAGGLGAAIVGAGATAASVATRASSRNSCVGRCDQDAGLGQCQCSPSCVSFGDCCSDYTSTCSTQGSGSCSGVCGEPFSRTRPCQCNFNCADFNNCCPDFSRFCSAPPPGPTAAPATARPSTATTAVRAASTADPVLGPFTEKLLSLDENNAMQKITINPGCTTRVGNPRDCSNSALFTAVDKSVFSAPVYARLFDFYENYDPDVTKVEDHTNPEKAEEVAFINEIMKTNVMKETYKFLRANSYFTKAESDFKSLLQELWFGIYSRGNRIMGSSGFEHVFLGEKKDGKVQGFHNWVYFYFLEQKNQVNYLGHWENVNLSGRGTGLSFTFTWGAEQKPFASMLVGTSPELEMAVYTTCLLAKGEDKCAVSLGGHEVDVEVHVFNRPKGVRYIASSFMDWI